MSNSCRRVSRFPYHAAACHAVAALLQLSDGRYLMQLRNSNPDIFYPEHWGCFGGAVDAGEAPVLRWCGNSRRNSR